MRIFTFDTTLRDGTQGETVSFTFEDKLLIAGDIIVVPTSNAKFYLQSIAMSAATSGVTSGFFILSKY